MIASSVLWRGRLAVGDRLAERIDANSSSCSAWYMSAFGPR
jgi:hypothetical protein